MSRARPRPPAGPPPASDAAPGLPLSPGATAACGIGIVILLLLIGVFFTTRLPNNAEVTRLDVLTSVPDLLLLCLPGGEADRTSGWKFFPQRLDLVALASLIWLSAWGLGRLVLRGIGLFSGLDRFERNLWGSAVGIGLWPVITLTLGLAGLLNPWLFWGMVLAAIGTEAVLAWRGRGPTKKTASLLEQRFLTGSPLPVVIGLAVAPFLVAMLLGAMLPPTDFDVREYHLEGPKEYFLAGRIHFLPHNVYTSFPFCTEMLHLLGMVLRGDWYRGALVGQTVLMGFAPLAAAGLFFAGRRWFSERAAWLAVLIWLTAPWTYRISTIAYTEGGLAAFLLLAFIAMVRAGEAWQTRPAASGAWFLVAGFLAGNGPACKYPGALSVAIPMFALAVWTVLRPFTPPPGDSPTPSLRDRSLAILLFLAGGAVAFGPWLLKNLFETGNPFYPLMYSVFGGRDWDAVMHARWQAGHPLPLGHFHGLMDVLWDQVLRFLDAFLWNDWQTPFALATLPLAVVLWFASLGPARSAVGLEMPSAARKLLGLLVLYALWLFDTWCLLSHRIDRFWVPMLPILCWIAAVVIDLLWGQPTARDGVPRLARVATLVTLLGGVTLYHLGFVASGICGNNAWLLDEKLARKQFRNASVAVLEDLPLPKQGKVLFVGEAEVFEAPFPNIYNTVFDRSIFEEWVSADPPGPTVWPPAPPESKAWPLKPADEIRRTLAAHGITHVAVNWSEILRYRPTYTYTDFVHPDRFLALVEMGILRRLPGVGTFRELKGVPGDQKQEIERWAPGLVQQFGGKALVPGVQVFEVIQ